MKYTIEIDGKTYQTEVTETGDGFARIMVDGESFDVKFASQEILEQAPAPKAVPISPQRPASVTVPPKPAAPARPAPHPRATPPSQTVQTAPSASQAGQKGAVIAPIPGLILSIKVSVGESVAAGQVVATMEAMKMENAVLSDTAGTVTEICVAKGDELATGDTILIIA